MYMYTGENRSSQPFRTGKNVLLGPLEAVRADRSPRAYHGVWCAAHQGHGYIRDLTDKG